MSPNDVIKMFGPYIYGAFAMIHSVVGAIEIGPNLLSAITAIIGLIVIFLQTRVAKDTREVKKVAEEGAQYTATLAETALKNREAIRKLEQWRDGE